MQVAFSRERNGEEEQSKHFFKNDVPEVIMARNNSPERIREKFNEFMVNTLGEVESWNNEGSNWDVDTLLLRGYCEV